MRGLIYKDFLVNKWNFLMCFLTECFMSFLLFAPYIDADEPAIDSSLSAMFGILSFSSIFFINGGFEMNIFLSDESKKWAYFVTSTPMRAEYQVQSKYWLIAIMSTLCMVLCGFFDALNCCITNDAVSVSALILLLFYIQIIVRSLEIPFIVRFGTNFGSYFKIAVFALVGFGALVYLLFGDLSHFGSMDDFWEWAIDFFSGDSKTLAVIITTLPYVSSVMFYLSYKISCRLYLKGAEHFEK